MGALNMLGLAKRVRARILQASPGDLRRSGDASPGGGVLGQRESDCPRSCYDEGKRVAETLLFDYHRQNDVDIRVIRFSTPTVRACRS